MRKFDPIIIGIIAITIIIFIGIIAVAFITQEKPISQYNINDAERPKLSINQTEFDFGKMKLIDIKTQDVEIKNIGTKSLVLSNFKTSCDCTFAQVVINGEESPRFSMGGSDGWQGEIIPQSSAIVKVIYEPKVMPVKGKVNRQVVFKTNDPENPLINISFTAEVE